MGISSGTASTGQQIGNAVGLTILVAVANSTDLRLTILLTAAGVLLTSAVALTGRRTPTLALSN